MESGQRSSPTRDTNRVVRPLAKDPWITGDACKQPRLRLLCFPYAGGGASYYRTWSAAMPADIEVRGVQLPGREGRHGEPPFRRLANAVDAVGAAIRPYLDRPFALFGHSMGASLAYEVARWLLAETGSEPVHLFVSARRAPHLPPRRRELHLLSDDAFIEGIRALNGTSAEIFEHPELIRLLLPTLRADFEMAETYKESDRPRLSCPITAIGGDIDQDVPAEDLSAWRIATSGRFQMRLFAGGHFYVNTARDELFRFLSVELAAFGEA